MGVCESSVEFIPIFRDGEQFGSLGVVSHGIRTTAFGKEYRELGIWINGIHFISAISLMQIATRDGVELSQIQKPVAIAQSVFEQNHPGMPTITQPHD
jgi:hypothetical protein